MLTLARSITHTFQGSEGNIEVEVLMNPTRTILLSIQLFKHVDVCEKDKSSASDDPLLLKIMTYMYLAAPD